MTFSDFKFQVGDVVRMRSVRSSGILAQEQAFSGVIILRSIHEDELGLISRSYAVRTPTGVDPIALECCLELANEK